MKFDSKTISILKNFSEINQSIIINPGNVINTISISRDVISESRLPFVFDKKICIYNLPQFIMTLKMFDDPDLDFTDNCVIISEGNKSVKYMYASENTLERSIVPEFNYPSDEVLVKFRLTDETLKNAEKALKTLMLPDLTIKGDGKNIFVCVENSQESSGHNYSIKIGETDKTFIAIFNSSTIKLIKDDYDVEICEKGISKFVGNTATYWIGFNFKSQF